jgi:hypothetical protein
MEESAEELFVLACAACPAARTIRATPEQRSAGFTDEELRREGYARNGSALYCHACARGAADVVKTVDLRGRGIDEAQAADLRARLRTFEEDWNHPAMDAYDRP